ncbi:MAG TPA: hypothetical protein VFQ61_26455 [Polyangiaceae bacterium]|nr:hypothetical protein [Polyangiaceae bacterium]
MLKDTKRQPERQLVEQLARSVPTASEEIPIGHSRVATLSATPEGAHLCVRAPSGAAELELELVTSEAGTTVRVRATAIAIQAQDIAAECRTFSVKASERIELSSGGELRETALTLTETAERIQVDATRGSVEVRANDDVQLLGERVLLNCDPPAPVPPWLAGTLQISPGNSVRFLGDQPAAPVTDSEGEGSGCR